MTTIAWDGNTLAVDSRCTIGEDIYDEKCKKLWKNVGVFSAVAMSGGNAEGENFIFNILAGVFAAEELLSLEVPKGFNILAVTGDGKCWMMNCVGVSQMDKRWALGSGGDYALAAMDLGKTAPEAVRFAATRDVYTNSRVQKFTVNRGET